MSVCPEIALDDYLFEEVFELKLNIDEYWAVIIKDNFSCIQKLFSAIFAIPAPKGYLVCRKYNGLIIETDWK